MLRHGTVSSLYAGDYRVPKKINKDELIELFKTVHGDKYDYSQFEYTSMRTESIIICRIHGGFRQIPHNHKNGKGCPQCGLTSRGDKRRGSVDNFIRKSKLIHGNKFDYSKVEYRRTHDKVCIICPEHGEFWQRPSAHLRGLGCFECTHPKLTVDDFRMKSQKHHGNKYNYDDVSFSNSHDKIQLVCQIHGTFTQTVHNHSHHGSGCPKCSNSGVSKAETEVFNFVRSICPDAVQSDRTIIGPLELDVVVPSHNLAIEFNGLYWHNERTKDKKYHITKRHRVEAAGYRLISIREDIWNERREQVENIIRNALGATSDKVFARKCNIVEVSTSEAKTFMEKHHVQGFRGATVHYGLQYDDTLVAVISLTNWQKKNEWELVRYATACNVPGGLSRLWKHATMVNNIIRAYSYVDRDLFSGSSYVNAGFTLSATTVGFRIVNGCTTESREKWNRAPDGMTQTQWYESEGVSRIYDSGQDKLLWVK